MARSDYLWTEVQQLFQHVPLIREYVKNVEHEKDLCAMLTFDNVTKSYWSQGDRKIILADASFHIPAGQALGILAANGTGKTTLINMMAGLEDPDEGTVHRSGRFSFPLGYVSGVTPSFTGAENVRFIANIYSMDPDYVESFCRWMAGLGSYMDMEVSTYSQGMRARLSFSLMLSLDFDCYLVDEGVPATADVDFNQRVDAVLRKRLEQASLIVVTHQQDVLMRYCTSACLLIDGALSLAMSPADAWKRYTDAG